MLLQLLSSNLIKSIHCLFFRYMEVKMQQILDGIYEELDSLYSKAMSLQEIWMRKIAEKEVSRRQRGMLGKEFTKFELRVEPNGQSFTVRWLSIRFVKHASRTKATRIAKSISIPANGHYKKTQFKSADDWEIELCTNADAVLAQIRVQVKHLMRAHQSILLASKSAGINVQVKPQKERLSRTSVTIQKLKEKMY